MTAEEFNNAVQDAARQIVDEMRGELHPIVIAACIQAAIIIAEDTDKLPLLQDKLQQTVDLLKEFNQ